MSSPDENATVIEEREGEAFSAVAFNAINEAVANAYDAADALDDERYKRRMAMFQQVDVPRDQWVADEKPIPAPKGIVAAPSVVMPLLKDRYADLDIDATNKAERTVYRMGGCGLPVVLEPRMPLNSYRIITEGEA